MIIFHTSLRTGTPITIGAAGVDIFFVISGVIMWTVTQASSVGAGSFLLGRLTRIAPAYTVLTVGMALTAVFVPRLFPGLQVTLPHVVLSILFIPHADPHGEVFPLLVAGWTLNYEMFFYVLFATGLWLPRRSRAAWCTGLIGGLVALGLLVPFQNVIAHTFTGNIMLEFLAGIWLGALRANGRLPSRQAGWLMLLASMAGFALSAPLHGRLPNLPQGVFWGIPSALFVGGALTMEARGGVARWTPALLLANASYSIYLVHALVVGAVIRLLGPSSGAVSVCLVFAASIAGSAACGVVYHRAVELPMTRLLRRRQRPSAPSSHTAAIPIGATPSAG